MANTRLLTVPEASKHLRITERTFSRLVARGDAPRLTRIGRRVFVSEPDLEAFIERSAQ